MAAEIDDMNKVIARWQDWSGKGLEHLVLTEGPDKIVADAVILGTTDDSVFAARYGTLCARLPFQLSNFDLIAADAVT
jgi:hypothetical protein